MTPEGRPETINDILHTLKGIKDTTEEFLETELKKQQDEFDANQYQRDRKLEYPTIEELVVALYDEEDKQAIIEKRASIKTKYPKPE